MRYRNSIRIVFSLRYLNLREIFPHLAKYGVRDYRLKILRFLLPKYVLTSKWAPINFVNIKKVVCSLSYPPRTRQACRSGSCRSRLDMTHDSQHDGRHDGMSRTGPPPQIGYGRGPNLPHFVVVVVHNVAARAGHTRARTN